MEIHETILAVRQNNNEAFGLLLETYKKMLYSIINSYELDYGDYLINKDDLFQEATIGLFEAAKYFDLEANIRFSTFAYTVIKRRVFRYYKKYRKEYEIASCSINEIDSLDHNMFLKTNAVEDNPIEYVKQLDNKQRISNPSSRLCEEDRTILLMRMNNYTYDEISKKLNIKKKRIDNRLTRLKRTYLKDC